jgi:ATP-dependent DNA helicase RecQ
MATAEGVEVFEDTIDQVSSDLHGRILLKREQKKALIDLLLKKDVLAVLPTGFGKSLIYQYFVLAKAKQRVHQGSVCASALIICPLLSIVDDQIKKHNISVLLPVD